MHETWQMQVGDAYGQILSASRCGFAVSSFVAKIVGLFRILQRRPNSAWALMWLFAFPLDPSKPKPGPPAVPKPNSIEASTIIKLGPSVFRQGAAAPHACRGWWQVLGPATVAVGWALRSSSDTVKRASFFISYSHHSEGRRVGVKPSKWTRPSNGHSVCCHGLFDTNALWGRLYQWVDQRVSTYLHGEGCTKSTVKILTGKLKKIRRERC